MVLGRILLTASSWLTRRIISKTIAHKTTNEIMKLVNVLIDAYTQGRVRRRILKRLAKTLIHKFVQAQTEEILQEGMRILRGKSMEARSRLKILDIFNAFGGGGACDENNIALETERRSHARYSGKRSERVRRRDGKERTSRSKRGVGGRRMGENSRDEEDMPEMEMMVRGDLGYGNDDARRQWHPLRNGNRRSVGRWYRHDDDVEEWQSVDSRERSFVDVSGQRNDWRTIR